MIKKIWGWFSQQSEVRQAKYINWKNTVQFHLKNQVLQKKELALEDLCH